MTDMIDDPAAQAVRRPPQSINSEQSILGGLMIDNNALDSIVDIIQPDDFYRRDHKIIYEHIAAMIQRGRPCRLADRRRVASRCRPRHRYWAALRILRNSSTTRPPLPTSAATPKSFTTSPFCDS